MSIVSINIEPLLLDKEESLDEAICFGAVRRGEQPLLIIEIIEFIRVAMNRISTICRIIVLLMVVSTPLNHRVSLTIASAN